MAECRLGVGMKTARTAIQLLKQFSVREGWLGVTDLSRRLGMDRGATHRMLQSLRAEGVIEQDPRTKLYGLGPALADLAFAQAREQRLAALAEPHLHALLERTGEGAVLVGADREGPVCLALAECRNKVRVVFDIAERLPWHSTASGLVLLAHMEPAQRAAILSRRLEQAASRTVTDPALIEQMCARVLEEGSIFLDGTHLDGVRAIAAPVRDRQGRVVAAISTAVPSQRLADDTIEPMVAQVRGAADAFSRALATNVDLLTASSFPSASQAIPLT